MLNESQIVDLIEIATNNFLAARDRDDLLAGKRWRQEIVLMCMILEYDHSEVGESIPDILIKLKEMYPKENAN